MYSAESEVQGMDQGPMLSGGGRETNNGEEQKPGRCDEVLGQM